MDSGFYCVIRQWYLFHCLRCFFSSINFTLSNMQCFRRVSPMLCGFLVFVTCKALAYDACTAALLLRQNIPVWSSFCLFRLDSFDSKKDRFLLIKLGWAFARCCFKGAGFMVLFENVFMQTRHWGIWRPSLIICKSKIQIIVLVLSLLLWHAILRLNFMLRINKSNNLNLISKKGWIARLGNEEKL